MFASLDKAIELEPSRETYTLLLKAYQDNGMVEEADVLESKIKKMSTSPKTKKRILRSRRVVI
jgi:pentatricopeptide repeat protein